MRVRKPAAGGKKSYLVHSFRFSHQINCHLKSEKFLKISLNQRNFWKISLNQRIRGNPPPREFAGIHFLAKWRKVTQVTKITGNFSDLSRMAFPYININFYFEFDKGLL